MLCDMIRTGGSERLHLRARTLSLAHHLQALQCSLHYIVFMVTTGAVTQTAERGVTPDEGSWVHDAVCKHTMNGM